MRKTHNTRQQHNKTLRKGNKNNKQKITKYIRRNRILKKKTSQNGLDDFRRSNNKTKKMKLQYKFFTKVRPRGPTLDDLGGGGGETDSVSNIEDMQIVKEQIFKEFIRFAYAELQTPGWRERMESLCGGLPTHGYYTLGFNTLSECEVHESDKERREEVVMTIIFKGMMDDGNWFTCWFHHTYSERLWMWVDPNNGLDLRDEFCLFLRDLSYEDLMDIIGIDMISLK